MINKTKNANLQLTISKKAYDKLLTIQSELVKTLSIELTKSQIIEYLINNYKANNKRDEKPRGKYQIIINALKNKLNVSWPRLAEIIGIPESTLKKYASGRQEPKDINKKLIDEMADKYGIK